MYVLFTHAYFFLFCQLRFLAGSVVLFLFPAAFWPCRRSTIQSLLSFSASGLFAFLPFPFAPWLTGVESIAQRRPPLFCGEAYFLYFLTLIYLNLLRTALLENTHECGVEWGGGKGRRESYTEYTIFGRCRRVSEAFRLPWLPFVSLHGSVTGFSAPFQFFADGKCSICSELLAPVRREASAGHRRGL